MRRVPALLLAVVLLLALYVVPTAQGRSAGSRVFVNCLTYFAKTRTVGFVARVRPRRCDVQGEPEYNANLLPAGEMRWSGWGRSTTLGRGVVVPTKGGGRIGLRMRLYRIRRGCQGRRYYTRATASTKHGTGTMRLTPGCKRTRR